MTQIIVDATTGNKLRDLAQPAELLDQSGQVLGHFTPAPDLPAALTEEPRLSEEEWQQLEQQAETYSTSEVLAHLEKL
jgi:hypothetical protein